ncbi:hypothetical protein SAMN02744778_03626 [Pantoea sp. GL120224-02]|nr:hypothetical protein SAMN02744778_03626 [Pantoea sp. GL120224-02]
MTVKIGLIGLGMIGRDHLKRFHHVISGAQVTAVCELTTQQPMPWRTNLVPPRFMMQKR